MRTNIHFGAGVAGTLVILVAASCAQPDPNRPQAASPPTPPSSAANTAGNSTEALEKVLRLMDNTAANFHAAQANFVWRVYNSVISDFVGPDDTGIIYLRRSGNDTQMAADLKPPDEKQIIFTGDKIQIYQPKAKEVDVYDASAHKEEFETFLVLGFGSSGEEMRKSFGLKYVGPETIAGVKTAKVELTPLSEKISTQFPKIDLWIDLQNGVSVQQQLFQRGGDYRLAKYSNIQLKSSLPKNVFELRKPGDVKIVTH